MKTVAASPLAFILDYMAEKIPSGIQNAAMKNNKLQISPLNSYRFGMLARRESWRCRPIKKRRSSLDLQRKLDVLDLKPPEQKRPESQHGEFQMTFYVSKPKFIGERVLYPSKPSTIVKRIAVTGGEPITEDLVKELRMVTFGSSDLVGIAADDWLDGSFGFNLPGSKEAWSLTVPKKGSKGLVMCVQAYFLKHLLYIKRRSRTATDPTSVMRPEIKNQEECFVSSLTDILWKAGDKKSATLCLLVDTSLVENNEHFRGDGVTERITYFTFHRQDELNFNIKKYLYQFVMEDGNGILLFLYSLLMTRGFKNLKEDMEQQQVPAITLNGTLSRCIAILTITGRATQNLHNGIIYEGSETTMARALTGIMLRSEIGFLQNNGSDVCNKIEVGSRLKTPNMPLWLILSGTDYGVLFSPNKDLMRDYHFENRFELHYYCGTRVNNGDITTLTIDTRNTSHLDYTSPPLEFVIQTKWNEATVMWNETEPYI